MEGNALIPVSFHPDGRDCEDCEAEREEAYYDRLNDSVARVGGA